MNRMSTQMSMPMQAPTTNQETAARGSYISIAASITAKFKCCFRGDTHNHINAHNTPQVEARAEVRAPVSSTLELPGEVDIEISLEEALELKP